MPGKAPTTVQGPGYLVVGISEDSRFVRVQFHDPDWWADFTAAEARYLANLLFKKAKELDASR
jgi:hypothetical protein